MKREYLLAAEVYGYSYENYKNHLGIGKVRYDRLMPNDALLLERAERERWDDARVARELEIELKNVSRFRKAIRHALFIVDAPDAAESFRRGVRVSIESALGNRLTGESEIESLVEQICYRAADFGYLLDQEGKQIAHYSHQLRHGVQMDVDEGAAENDIS
jgi:plasmid stabilization system protein ParE